MVVQPREASLEDLVKGSESLWLKTLISLKALESRHQTIRMRWSAEEDGIESDRSCLSITVSRKQFRRSRD
jgi:hypothetical protein